MRTPEQKEQIENLTAEQIAKHVRITNWKAIVELAFEAGFRAAVEGENCDVEKYDLIDNITVRVKNERANSRK